MSKNKYETIPLEHLHDFNLAALPDEERDLATAVFAGRIVEVKTARAKIEVGAAEAGRELTASEHRKMDRLARESSALTDLLERGEKFDAAMRAVPIGGDNGAPRIQVGRESATYRKGDRETSYFKDLIARSLHQDSAAAGRLERHRHEMLADVETRALSTAANVGGEFLPPLHLQSEWIELARAARPFANAVGSRPIPAIGMSFSVPKVTAGSSTGVQASENSTISNTDPDTDDIELPVATVAGYVDLSTQAFERSNPGLDEVVLGDLAADYATKVDLQLLNGSGANGQVQGILTDSAINSVTYTDASPTVAEFYPKLADAIQRVHTGRFMPPSAIFMHPRRWSWFLSALDSQTRPLITPVAPANAAGQFGAVASENIVGSLQGLPVIVDSSIPTTGGAGTNEDVVIVSRVSDNMFYESAAPILRVFEEPLSASLGVRLRAHGYIAFTSERYSKAHTKLSGTGLAAPSFS